VRRAQAYVLAEHKSNAMQAEVERWSEITSDRNSATVTVKERIAAAFD
jgi:hypothetical protein